MRLVMRISKACIILFGFALYIPFFAYADFSYEEPQGFHWYTQQQEAKPQEEKKERVFKGFAEGRSK